MDESLPLLRRRSLEDAWAGLVERRQAPTLREALRMLPIEALKIVVGRCLDGEALIEIGEDAQILSKHFS